MGERFLWPISGGNSAIAQTPQSWQNVYPFSTTTTTTTTTANHERNHPLFGNDDNDDGDGDIQFVSEVRPVSSRPTDTEDLSKSIFDVVKNEFDVYLNVNGRNTHSMAKNAAHSKNHTKPHTITTGQTSAETTVFDPHGITLPNPNPQVFPQITVANFAKENVINSNEVSASNDLLNSLCGSANWVEEADVTNNIFDNDHTEQLPVSIPTSPATSTADDLKWENMFGVMKHNLPGPSGISPRQNYTNLEGSCEWYGRRIITPFTVNAPLVTPNGTSSIYEQNKPGTSAANWTEPFLPPTDNVNTMGIDIYRRNQPGTGPSAAAPNSTGPFVPQKNDVFGIKNQPGTSAAEPNWIGPLLPQTNKVNTTVMYQQQNQMAANGIMNQPPIVNGMLVTPNGTRIGQNIKRKYTATIPIKIVRGTKQYETLVEMGFPKKDIENALRKCNLDLHQTIDYLSEPKRATKKQKMNHNDLNPFKAEFQNHNDLNPFHDSEFLYAIQQSLREPNIQQPHEQPQKVGAEPANLYEELLQLEETGGIVKSIESFDCEICMETIEMKDGMILRNCLHRYCKDCLNGTIVHSDEVSIKCPNVSCEEMVQDREIRAVLSQDEYEKFLMKSVRVAQVTISGTILCNFPDCDGWCICEDVVNEFKCPQCKNINCIPCKAIHPGRNCREYQDDLAAGDASGIISGRRRSEQAIEDLIKRNEAMKCFKCGILIMKRDGCDYIQCAMCKAGICWATRGPRYGPGGVGDLSGGCQCSSQKKCHKDCRGCH